MGYNLEVKTHGWLTNFGGALLFLIIFIAGNVVGVLYFSDAPTPDVDGKYNGFTEEELRAQDAESEGLVPEAKCGISIGTETISADYKYIYFDKEVHEPEIGDGVIIFKEIND